MSEIPRIAPITNEEARELFEKGEDLGSGSYGIVKKTFYQGTPIILKRFKPDVRFEEIYSGNLVTGYRFKTTQEIWLQDALKEYKNHVTLWENLMSSTSHGTQLMCAKYIAQPVRNANIDQWLKLKLSKDELERSLPRDSLPVLAQVQARGVPVADLSANQV